MMRVTAEKDRNENMSKCRPLKNEDPTTKLIDFLNAVSLTIISYIFWLIRSGIWWLYSIV